MDLCGIISLKAQLTDRYVTQIISLLRNISLLIIFLLTLQGCSQKSASAAAQPVMEEAVTETYLFEHRIIAYAPELHERRVTTLPFERIMFDERFSLHLVGLLHEDRDDLFYLWVERRADAWREYTTAYVRHIGRLPLERHFSRIRHGQFYEEYSVDLRLEQIRRFETSGLKVTLSNAKGEHSTLTLPPAYVKAFVKIVEDD